MLGAHKPMEGFSPPLLYFFMIELLDCLWELIKIVFLNPYLPDYMLHILETSYGILK